MTAALKCLTDYAPDCHYHLIGHSAGGQLVGLMKNAHQFSSLYNVACSSGQLRNMSLSYQIKAHFFMNLVIPMSNQVFGHTKSQWFGMGEPLPAGVAAQWRHWCNGQEYVKTAFEHSIFDHEYDRLSMPAMWVHGSDDPIANGENVRDMQSVYSRIAHQTLCLEPEEFQLKENRAYEIFQPS